MCIQTHKKTQGSQNKVLVLFIGQEELEIANSVNFLVVRFLRGRGLE